MRLCIFLAGLTMNEIVGNAVVFILAGFQTTADTLLFLFYELAMYPDIQQRVCLIMLNLSCLPTFQFF